MTNNNLIRKCLVIAIIFLFVGVGVFPSISGTITKKSDSEIEKKILNENAFSDPLLTTGEENSYSFGFHTFDKFGEKQQNVALPKDDADKIIDVLEELKYKIVYEPRSEETKALKNEFVDLLDAYGLIPADLSKSDVLSLLNPSWLKNKQRTPTTRTRTPLLKSFKSSISEKIVNLQQIFKNRFEKTILKNFDRNTMMPSSYADTATATFCSISSGGSGTTFPLVLLPRPRGIATWSASLAVTLVGELRTGKGFTAEGAQTGTVLGFMGLGLTYAVPGYTMYGFVGYALFTSVNAESIEFYEPPEPPNQAPVISDENPSSGTWNIPINLPELSFRISDADGEQMDYTVTTEPNIGSGSGNNKGNGEYTVPISGLQADKWYTWTVEVTDGKNTVNRESSFFTGDMPGTIFFDDFNDNVKDYDKWTEIANDGTWFEQNQRTEFHLNAGGNAVAEGIESIYVPVTITQDDPVIISVDIISYISGSSSSGQTRFAVTDGTNSITINYYRPENQLLFLDSNDPSGWTILGTRGDGSWDNQIIIFSNRYRVQMDTFDSGWVYDPLFSSSSSIKVKPHMKFEMPSGDWQAGYDSIIIKGIN